MKHRLAIDCVNRVKLEKADEFQDSIFCDVYLMAHFQTERILQANKEYAESIKNNEAEMFCNGNEINNVISFIGKRGMGKSSAMLSFAYYLKSYEKKADKMPEALRLRNEPGFYVLPKVDAGMLSHETVLDFILAKMWMEFSKKIAAETDTDCLYNRTKESFNSIKNAYSLYYQEPNRELSSARQLEELSRSMGLREKFAGLVTDFLGCMEESKCGKKKDYYLVIVIDDLDMASRDIFGTLEQLRVFLSVPQVIVLVSLDIEKITISTNKRFSEELLHSTMQGYEIDCVREYADQYVAKALPRNSRIYMPVVDRLKLRSFCINLKDLEESSSWREVIIALNEECNYYVFIDMIIARYINTMICYETLSISDTLRNVVNKAHELLKICTSDKEDQHAMIYNWLEKECMISIYQLSDKNDVEFMNTLINASEKDLHPIVAEHFLKEILMDSRRNYYSYGRIMDILLRFRRSGIYNINLIKEILLLYSTRISKHIREADFESMEDRKRQGDIAALHTVDEIFVRGDIWSSAFDQQLFGAKNISLEKVVNISLDIQQGGEVSVILNNQYNIKMLMDTFKMMLFCDIESILTNNIFSVENEKSFMFRRGKEGEVSEIIRIKTEEKKHTRISIDNFFRNVVEYDEYYNRFMQYIVGAIGKHFEKKNMEKRKYHFPVQKEMHIWKEKYNVRHVYDILPVQNMGLMLEVTERARISDKVQNFSEAIKILTDTFIEVFREAEEECHYELLKGSSYSEKMRELMDAIKLESVTPDIANKFRNMAPGMEDSESIKG